jgi:hypothetical protein
MGRALTSNEISFIRKLNLSPGVEKATVVFWQNSEKEKIMNVGVWKNVIGFLIVVMVMVILWANVLYENDLLLKTNNLAILVLWIMVFLSAIVTIVNFFEATFRDDKHPPLLEPKQLLYWRETSFFRKAFSGLIPVLLAIGLALNGYIFLTIFYLAAVFWGWMTKKVVRNAIQECMDKIEQAATT